MFECVFVLSNFIVFVNIDYITHICSFHALFHFFFFFHDIHFLYSKQEFPIALRDGGGPPVEGMENVAGFFY